MSSSALEVTSPVSPNLPAGSPVSSNWLESPSEAAAVQSLEEALADELGQGTCGNAKESQGLENDATAWLQEPRKPEHPAAPPTPVYTPCWAQCGAVGTTSDAARSKHSLCAGCSSAKLMLRRDASDARKNGDDGPTKRLKQFTMAQPEEFKGLLRRLKAMFAGEAPAHRRAIAGELLADTSSSVKVADSVRVVFLTQREWVARRIQMWMCTPEEAEEYWTRGEGASAPNKEGGRRGMTLPPWTDMPVGRESKWSVASVVGLLGPTDERLALESVGTHAGKTHPSNPVFAGLGSGAWAPGAAGSSAAPTDASLSAGAQRGRAQREEPSGVRQGAAAGAFRPGASARGPARAGNRR